MNIEDAIGLMVGVVGRNGTDIPFLTSIHTKVQSGYALTEKQVAQAEKWFIRMSHAFSPTVEDQIRHAFTSRTLKYGLRVIAKKNIMRLIDKDIVELSFPYNETIINDLRTIQRQSDRRLVTCEKKPSGWFWYVKVQKSIIPFIEFLINERDFDPDDETVRVLDDYLDFPTGHVYLDHEEDLLIMSPDMNVQEWLAFMEHWK